MRFITEVLKTTFIRESFLDNFREVLNLLFPDKFILVEKLSCYKMGLTIFSPI